MTDTALPLDLTWAHHAPPSGAFVTTAHDVRETSGFLVADSRGRLVGRVTGPMYGTSKDIPDALSVRFGFLWWRRRIVPAEAIAQIDPQTKVISLRIERELVRAFL
jgi:hypothetical protein